MERTDESQPDFPERKNVSKKVEFALLKRKKTEYNALVTRSEGRNGGRP